MKKRTINTIDAINGYCIRNEKADTEFLTRHGIRRLTANKDILEMDRNIETLLELLLVDNFPGGGYNNSDDYFIAEADGNQYLVLEHAGQWFIGHNHADTRKGVLICADPDYRFTCTVPVKALRLHDILTKGGYSKEKPFVLPKPLIVTMSLDMPGVLDFFEPTVTAVRPEAGTITLLTEKGGTVIVTESDDDETRTYWHISELETIITSSLAPAPEARTPRDEARDLLAGAVPVGTLTLPEGTPVLFREADGTLTRYDLLEVSANGGNPLVRYALDGERFCDPAGDLDEGDILSVLVAIGRPGKDLEAPKPDWRFTYEEEFPDTAGYNCAGILRDKNTDSPFSCLFFHILKDNDDDEVETMHIYSSLYNLFDGDCDEVSFPWTSENEDILIECLNGIPDPTDLCGEGSPIRQLEFRQPE